MKFYTIIFALIAIFVAGTVESKVNIVHDSDIFLDIQYNDHKAISRFFRAKDDINIVNDYGQTLLMKAVQVGNKSLVKRLFSKRVDVNLVDDFGKTALDYAVEHNNTKLVLLLAKQHTMVTTQPNLAKVRQIITSKVRLNKAIWSICKGFMFVFLGITTFGLGAMLLTPTIKGLEVGLTIVGASYAAFFGILGTPFHVGLISWQDRREWYNHNLIRHNVVVTS
tara:strand:+ start:81 stop:749 length:669 start_codon:yes stop_codon:yes gene_type:complete